MVWFAEVAAPKYGLKTVDIIVELGRRRVVDGREDMIVDVALDLLQQAGSAAGEQARVDTTPTRSRSAPS